MAWPYLCIAGGFEIMFALGLKSTNGFTRLIPSVLTVVSGVANVLILSQALRTLPVGTGYAMWTGIGAVGTAHLGVVRRQRHEPALGGCGARDLKQMPPEFVVQCQTVDIVEVI